MLCALCTRCALMRVQVMPVDDGGGEDPKGRAPLTSDTAQRLIGRNAEALQRCAALSPPATAAAAARVLFAGEHGNDVPGRLLDHLPE